MVQQGISLSVTQKQTYNVSRAHSLCQQKFWNQDTAQPTGPSLVADHRSKLGSRTFWTRTNWSRKTLLLPQKDQQRAVMRTTSGEMTRYKPYTHTDTKRFDEDQEGKERTRTALWIFYICVTPGLHGKKCMATRPSRFSPG